MIHASVIVPTHNPNPVRLGRTLEGLARQTLSADRWELIIVDNASTTPVTLDVIPAKLAGRTRIVSEPRLGLSSARAAGFREARADIILLVDDDNVLAADYLETTIRHFSERADLGMLGGKSAPEFEREPLDWQREIFPLLALRDLGPEPLFSEVATQSEGRRIDYPAFAPIGAGMALRRRVADGWLSRGAGGGLSDRRGAELTSSGDNDIVLCAIEDGWRVAYFPDLSLTHLIPSGRLETGYLKRLNRGIQKSWMQVLTLHKANPWPTLSRSDARLRIIKAWFAHRPWASDAAAVRFEGARGHFEGRVRHQP